MSDADRAREFSRRALLHAGWVVPVVLTLEPTAAFAQSPGGHVDSPHTDTGSSHGDAHLDSPNHDDVHADMFIHLDTAGPPHGDADHFDSHDDHGDHIDQHLDFVGSPDSG
jgi:hypothetical protein